MMIARAMQESKFRTASRLDVVRVGNQAGRPRFPNFPAILHHSGLECPPAGEAARTRYCSSVMDWILLRISWR